MVNLINFISKCILLKNDILNLDEMKCDMVYESLSFYSKIIISKAILYFGVIDFYSLILISFWY